MSDKTQLVAAWLGLLVSAWPLDRVVEHFVFRLPPKSLLRATDTAVHGLIGGFSYWMAFTMCPDLVLSVSSLLLCGSESNRGEASKEPQALNMFFSFCVAFMISSCVDLDHIIKNVIQIINDNTFDTNLSCQSQPAGPWERGWLHLSLPPVVLTCILYSSAVPFHSLWCVRGAALTVLGVLSHHIRDGVHHGLDFYPLGTTPILPYWLYVVVTLTLPIVCSHLSSCIIQLVKSSLESPARIIHAV